MRDKGRLMPNKSKDLEGELIGDWIDKDAFEEKIRDIKGIKIYEELDFDNIYEFGYATVFDYRIIKDEKSSKLYFFEEKQNMYGLRLVVEL